MFGKMEEPKPNVRIRPRPVPVDIKFPMQQPGMYGHPAREPNTDYPSRLMLYKQRKSDEYHRKIEGAKAQIGKDEFFINVQKHVDDKRFRNELQKRLDEKMDEYEAAIERRRDKLRELLSEEEHQYYYETVDNAQKGDETRQDDMKKRANELIAKREAERLEIVKEKRLQQYMNRCLDLRDALTKKSLIESKSGNLEQMKETEARREADRELEQMWYGLTLKEVQAKKEREEHEAIEKYERNKQMVEVLDMQVKGKELLRQEIKRVTLEDRMELEKITTEIKRKQMEALIQTRKRRDETDKMLREQVETQRRFVEKRKTDEEAVDAAFARLAQLELEKEKALQVDSVTASKKELVMYHQSLVELDEQRRDEDRLFNKLLEEYKKDVERKQDEARCKIMKSKQKLKEETMKGREEQIKYKKIIAEEELKMKQDDNELARYAHEVNSRLDTEVTRQEKIAKQQYRDDLIKQIEYRRLLQQREKADLERQLAVGREEEDRYQKLVSDMCSGKILIKQEHPFRHVFEQYDCHCPELPTKPR